MVSISERCADILKIIKRGETKLPTQLSIQDDHINNKGEKVGTIFLANEHYFNVRINQLYLAYGRQWFVKYTPMVFTVTEFIYGNKIESIPFIVGPMMLEKYGKLDVGTGMVFSNTRVAGLHPYRGGSLNISIILYRLPVVDYAKNILKMVEKTAGILDFATTFGSYMKLANLILDGFEMLLGLEETKPIIGLRTEFDPDTGYTLKPGYFALIDKPGLKINELRVRDRQLLYGENEEKAQPFREADFVLYSIGQTTERTDIRNLHFYPLWEHVANEAAKPREDTWKSANHNMVTLWQEMRSSADLTDRQSIEIATKFKKEMKEIYDKSVAMATLGPKKKRLSRSEIIRKESLEAFSI
jgi:hypothetical protein